MIICFFCISAVGAFAAYTPPRPTGYVNDFANVISKENFIKLDRLVQEVKSKTGAEIAVVTLQSLDGYPIEDIGLAIGRDWGVGEKGKDNGVVVVVAPNDRKMRIEVGYGLEGAIPDSAAGRIRDGYMIPYFKTGDYSSGIFYGTQAVAGAIAKEYGVQLSSSEALPEPVNSSSDSDDAPPGLVIFVLILLIIIRFRFPFVGGYYGSSGGFGGGGGGFGGFGGGGFGGGGCSGGW